MQIVPIKQEINSDAIEMLKDAIARLESGELVQVSIAWIGANGVISGEISSGNNNFLSWCALAHMERSAYRQLILEE